MFTTTPVWPAGTTVKQLAATIITATIAAMKAMSLPALNWPFLSLNMFLSSEFNTIAVIITYVGRIMGNGRKNKCEKTGIRANICVYGIFKSFCAAYML